MDHGQLKRHFPHGLVLGQNSIAMYEPERDATGPLIDFDAAYEIIGDKGMQEILDRGSCLLYSKDEKALRAVAKPNPKSL